MNRFRWILVLLAMAAPAWSASNKKISVQDLNDLLTSLQDAKKSDEDVAAQLKQVELTEELTSTTMNTFTDRIPGPLSTEQLYVLEARSAALPPPASDLPAAPAPDAAAQQAMLAKAAEFATKTYPQLPHLTATKLTGRFQDGVEAIHTYTGANHNLSQSDDPLWEQTRLYVRLLGTHTETIESENGIEKIPATKEKPQWGPNGQVASLGPALTLNTVVQEAMANGSPKFLRWEKVNGNQTAVFSFAIDKKKTHFAVNYCCFPNTDTAGLINYGSGAGSSPSTGGGATGSNFQSVSDWKPFKANVGYHGEIFLDPDSGTVVRTITMASFKPSDFVHSETIRTDFAPRPVGDKTLIVPVRSFTISEVVPNGDSFAAHYSVRHQMVTQDYKDYQLAGATAQK
ncbi:hypothetical protein [Acidicapsa acidisoli]|uniref:hypothetical protein n=1 Tax=Acidicapsa acidisoli TaxID=1615681 RepID=UPI0021E0509E|nr:hypothetical protein [Acidicapsa acidisoli]